MLNPFKKPDDKKKLVKKKKQRSGSSGDGDPGPSSARPGMPGRSLLSRISSGNLRRAQKDAAPPPVPIREISSPLNTVRWPVGPGASSFTRPNLTTQAPPVEGSSSAAATGMGSAAGDSQSSDNRRDSGETIRVAYRRTSEDPTPPPVPRLSVFPGGPTTRYVARPPSSATIIRESTFEDLLPSPVTAPPPPPAPAPASRPSPAAVRRRRLAAADSRPSDNRRDSGETINVAYHRTAGDPIPAAVPRRSVFPHQSRYVHRPPSVATTIRESAFEDRPLSDISDTGSPTFSERPDSTAATIGQRSDSSTGSCDAEEQGIEEDDDRAYERERRMRYRPGGASGSRTRPEQFELGGTRSEEIAAREHYTPGNDPSLKFYQSRHQEYNMF